MSKDDYTVLVNTTYKLVNGHPPGQGVPKPYVNPGVIENSPNVVEVGPNNLLDNEPFQRCPRVFNKTD